MLLDFAPKIIHCYNTYFSIFLQFLSKQGGLKGIIAGPHQGSAGYCTGLSVTHPKAERVTFFVTTLRHLKSCNIIPHTGARAFPAPIFPGCPNRIDYVVVHTHLLNAIINTLKSTLLLPGHTAGSKRLHFKIKTINFTEYFEPLRNVTGLKIVVILLRKGKISARKAIVLYRINGRVLSGVSGVAQGLTQFPCKYNGTQYLGIISSESCRRSLACKTFSS